MNCPHCGIDIDEHEANRCLDTWVAELIMGLDLSERKNHTWIEVEEPEYKQSVFECSVCGELPGWVNYNELEKYAPGPCKPRPPYYSTSIAAAWEIVQKLLNEHYIFVLNLGTFHEAGFLNIHKGKGEARTAYFDDNSGCLVICRAAIKAVSDGLQP